VTFWSPGRLVRILVAASLTAFVLWKASPSAVWHAGSRAHGWWIAGALALVLLDRALMAYRWLVLVRVFEPPDRLPLTTILRVFFVSTFVGTFLPTSIGGDAVRAYSLTRTNARGASSVASVLMDRLLGVVSLLVVTVAGLAFARDLLHESAVAVALALTGAACAAGMAIIYSERVAAVARRVFVRIPAAAAQRVAHDLVDAVRAYATRHDVVANVLAGSIVVQVLRVAQAWALARALGIGLPFTPYFAFVPIILLVMLLPISVYGLGTSQLAFTALFGRAGVPAGDAVALSLLFLSLGIVGNLPGAFLYMTGDGQDPAKARR
jgi:uncharacterized protein (TIRG00374 family)